MKAKCNWICLMVMKESPVFESVWINSVFKEKKSTGEVMVIKQSKFLIVCLQIKRFDWRISFQKIVCVSKNNLTFKEISTYKLFCRKPWGQREDSHLSEKLAWESPRGKSHYTLLLQPSDKQEVEFPLIQINPQLGFHLLWIYGNLQILGSFHQAH